MKISLIGPLTTIGVWMLMLACSSFPEPINPNPPGPILTLTDAERLAVLKECEDFVNALGDLKSAAAQQVLVAWLNARPEFEEADTLGGNVWAYFYDGRVVMFVPDWRINDGNSGGRIPQPTPDGGYKPPSTGGRSEGMPASNQIKMFYGLGTAFKDYRPFLKSIFSGSHTQYNVLLEDATIENLKNTNDLAIFYIDTHGGLGRMKPRSANRGLFGLWTKDTTSLESEVTYAAELNSNYIVYMLARQNRGAGSEWHYAITENYVKNHAYMNFAENAMIFIDACNGMTPVASTFKRAMMGKAQGGKATYVGWSGKTDDIAGEAATGFIFDRLLGKNVDLNASSGTIAAEEPKQRPFDLSKIFDELPTFSAGGYPLGVSQHGGKLSYESVSASEIIFTPSIEYITVNDYDSQITIKGLFGDKDEVIVTVGGVSVPVESWSPNEIVCDIPVSGPGSSGDVIVTINHNKSNTVPLSEWNIPVHLLNDDFGIKIDARLNLKLRADVHKFRLEPGEEPRTERPDRIELPPGSMGYPFSLASTGTFSVGGVRTASCTLDDCIVRDTEDVMTRTGAVPFSITTPGLAYSAYYEWSKDLKNITVYIIVNIPDIGYQMELYTSCDGKAVTSRQSSATTFGIFTSKAPALPPLVFHLDENYNIKEGRIEGMQNRPWGRCKFPGYFKHSASWPSVAPTVRPTAATEARIATGN